MKQNPFSKFTRQHPVLANSLMAIVVFCAGIYAIFLFLDIFTDHGTEVKVPEVRFKPLNQAVELLDSAGLDYEVDSVYNEDSTPGMVIDQTPEPGSMVKATRVVLLTVNMMQPPIVALPANLTNEGGADGMTALHELGFLHITTDTVPSPDQGRIIDITVNGRKTVVGTKVAVNAKIVLSIGDGSMDPQEYDPLTPSERDTLVKRQIQEGKITITTDSAGRQIVIQN